MDAPSRDALAHHIVICNWNDLGDEIIRQVHAPVVGSSQPVVIVTDQPQAVPQMEPVGGDDPYRNVFVIPGDPTSDKVLARANIACADTAIILADMRAPEHADTKSILIALAVEAIEPSVHTVVELLHSRNRIHFERTSVDEVVCVDELTEKLLAQCALTHGLSEFYNRLLTATEDTNEVYVVPVPPGFEGRRYRDLERALASYQREAVILIGIETEQEPAGAAAHAAPRRRLTINPPPSADASSGEVDRDHILRPGDRLFVLAYRPPSLDELTPPEA